MFACTPLFNKVIWPTCFPPHGPQPKMSLLPHVWMTCHDAIYTLLSVSRCIKILIVAQPAGSLLISCLQWLTMEVTTHETRRPQPFFMLFSCQVIFHVCFGSGPLAFYSTSEELSLCSASSVFPV